ncbi:MAG TPA: hypothetical protein VNN81_09730, partial [Bradyrhizobium sp.]|nr:hypothetical protein [Bradyrhizobium sp.]
MSELVDLRWEQVDFNHAVLRVHTKPPPPAIVNRTVNMPRRRPKAELRSREHLTDAEIERLMATAWNNRWGPPRRDHDGDGESKGRVRMTTVDDRMPTKDLEVEVREPAWSHQ